MAARIMGELAVYLRSPAVIGEILAGVTTFLTMAYILVLQPNILSMDFAGQPTGLDVGAVFLATCLASAVATGLIPTNDSDDDGRQAA